MSYDNLEKLAAMSGGSVANAAAKKGDMYRRMRKFRMQLAGGSLHRLGGGSVAEAAAKKMQMYRNLQKFKR